jgi:hypothetical protein
MLLTHDIVEFDLREVFKFGSHNDQGDDAGRRDVCRSLDVTFALGGVVMYVHSPSNGP